MERPELLGDPLRVIEPVDPEDEPAVRLRRADPLGLLDHRGIAAAPLELGHVDRDRERAHPHLALPHPQRPDRAPALDLDLRQEQADALHEVPAVPNRLESDEVVREQRVQDLEAPWKLQEDVERRKRDVEEERDARAHSERAELGRDTHEVVVVDPHESSGRTVRATLSANLRFTAS